MLTAPETEKRLKLIYCISSKYSSQKDAVAKGWYDASGMNLCYVSYRFRGDPIPTIKTAAVEYVASQSLRFVTERNPKVANLTREYSSQIKVVAHRLGVQVAVHFCRQIKVTFLLGKTFHLIFLIFFNLLSILK